MTKGLSIAGLAALLVVVGCGGSDTPQPTQSGTQGAGTTVQKTGVGQEETDPSVSVKVGPDNSADENGNGGGPKKRVD